MHPEATVRTALALVADGLEPTEVGRRLGVPKSTVQYRCRGGRRGPRAPRQQHPCPRCDGAPPGRKHERPITLEPWQVDLIRRYPGRLLRGLFHSDGCRVVNWAQKRTEAGTARYEYPRYLFSNKSEDILGICEEALDLVDVAHRRSRWDTISVARRAAVAGLDEFVGPKY